MQFDWWTLGLQTVNFAVLVWLMRRFLYQPVLRMLDARHVEIEAQYAEAHAAEAKAKNELISIEAKFKDIANERETMLQTAAIQAEEAAKARRAEAEVEAAAFVEAARKSLAAERSMVLSEARNLALDLGLDIARRLLAEAPANLQSEASLERIEQFLEALPDTEREALLRQVGDGASLIVATASPLEAETAEKWRTRILRRLGDGINIAFATDPELIAGAELRFPNAELRFSWRNALATARAEVEA
jgi:F-type H+-transporting ATPase subunit b